MSIPIPHSAVRLPKRVDEVVRQTHRHRHLRSELLKVEIVHEQQIVVHRFRREQREIEIGTVLEGAPERVAGEQPRRRHRRAEQGVLERHNFEPGPGGGGERLQHLRHKGRHRGAGDDADPLARQAGTEPARRGGDARLQVAHGADAILALLEVAVPGRGRQRFTGLEVQVVRAEAPREPALLERSGRKVPHRRQGRPAIVHRGLADQLVLAELRERHRHDRDRQDHVSQAVQVAQRPHQLRPVVHPGHEHHLGVKRDPPLPEGAQLGDDLGRIGVAQQPAAHRRVGGVHRHVQRREAVLDDPLLVPGLQVREGREIAVAERQAVVVIADVERRPHRLRIPVHKTEVAVIGAAADTRGLERHPHRHPLGTLDVVLDLVA